MESTVDVLLVCAGEFGLSSKKGLLRSLEKSVMAACRTEKVWRWVRGVGLTQEWWRSEREIVHLWQESLGCVPCKPARASFAFGISAQWLEMTGQQWCSTP